ncbi:uncharacterized protein MELLADRAFT_114246 [Melampsora larici-populina 98AG31]|uniref:Uncharacterized protein n=1 Tax=Melampsora larici-populina (strain 98AG31 / pathotype 3-4-7) TaxID=747676 RepID=F4SCS6_MELLP|nr:uncharacterized protein MELLADRAFT_114246 [Melampsora larici-populina 98AG31]EGF97551.1 hypothetical protein MELLADRAFT_114246 [Melampsora larici-populina 98AG31]
MSSMMCTVCHQQQSSYCDMCGSCLDNCLASTTPSPVEPTSGPASMEQGLSLLVNPSNPYPQPNHPPNLIPNYLQHTTPSSHPSSSASFSSHAFKHAAATVAAHNNFLQHPPTPSSHLLPHLPGHTSSQSFDPLAVAKENSTCTASGFPATRAEQSRGGTGTTTST